LIFLTSDTHFNHHNIIEYDQRPFKDIKEMNECIINNWNEVVKQDDIVYHLGDFGIGRVNDLKAICKRLNGNICLVRGNHDERSITKLVEIGIKLVADSLCLNYKGFIVEMAHMPDQTYYDWDGLLHIHGHTHHTQQFNKNLINVSCNAWDYKPVSLDELIINYKKNKRGKKWNIK